MRTNSCLYVITCTITYNHGTHAYNIKFYFQNKKPNFNNVFDQHEKFVNIFKIHR